MRRYSQVDRHHFIVTDARAKVQPISTSLRRILNTADAHSIVLAIGTEIAAGESFPGVVVRQYERVKADPTGGAIERFADFAREVFAGAEVRTPEVA